MNPKGRNLKDQLPTRRAYKINFFSLDSFNYDAKHVLSRQEGVMKWNCFPGDYRIMLKETVKVSRKFYTVKLLHEYATAVFTVNLWCLLQYNPENLVSLSIVFVNSLITILQLQQHGEE